MVSPRSDLRAAKQQVLRRHSLEHHRRRGPIVDRVREPHEPPRRHHPNLRVPPQHPGVGDPITDPHLRHVRPHRVDHPRPFLPGNERQPGRLVKAGPEIHVHEVETDGRLPDPGLPRPGRRLGDVFLAELIRAPELTNDDGFRHVPGLKRSPAGRFRQAGGPCYH